jgi:hypothetical protein
MRWPTSSAEDSGTRLAEFTRSKWISWFSCILLVGLVFAIILNACHLLPEVGCLFRAKTGLPCPFCGMGRSVIATFELSLGKAFLYNPFGVLLLAVVLMNSCLLFLPESRERLAHCMESNNTYCWWVINLSKCLFLLYVFGRMLVVYLQWVTF